MNETMVMNQRIVWDPRKLKQIDEAKSEILKYKRKGHLIIKADGTPMDHFDPSLGEVIIKAALNLGRHVMMILCDKGDDLIVWDKDNGRQAKEAKKKFMDLIGKKYQAYSVDKKGNKNRRITEFDVEAEQIIMVPPTSRG